MKSTKADKIIFEFDYPSYCVERVTDNLIEATDGTNRIAYPRYSQSIDRLIPVWKKIQGLTHVSRRFSVNFTSNTNSAMFQHGNCTPDKVKLKTVEESCAVMTAQTIERYVEMDR